jgi:hypothetical protein
MCFPWGKDRPDVIVDLIFERGMFFIALSNIGKAPAHSIMVEFNREIRGVEGSKLISQMPLFRRLEFMPPQKKIVAFLDSSASYFKRQQPVEIETVVTFKDRRGKSFLNRIKHNLEVYQDIGYIG